MIYASNNSNLTQIDDVMIGMATNIYVKRRAQEKRTSDVDNSFEYSWKGDQSFVHQETRGESKKPKYSQAVVNSLRQSHTKKTQHCYFCRHIKLHSSNQWQAKQRGIR